MITGVNYSSESIFIDHILNRSFVFALMCSLYISSKEKKAPTRDAFSNFVIEFFYFFTNLFCSVDVLMRYTPEDKFEISMLFFPAIKFPVATTCPIELINW